MHKKDIEKLIPEINWINDKSLRDKTYDIFADAMEKGNWNIDNINNSPATLLRKTDISSIEHLRDVCKTCSLVFPIIKKYADRHGVEFDYDTVICGALLHDVGKYFEVEADKNGNARYSPQAKMLKHPLMGAILAGKYEMPDKIIQIIAFHSSEGEKINHTLESKFVREIDTLVFYNSVYGIFPKNDIK